MRFLHFAVPATNQSTTLTYLHTESAYQSSNGRSVKLKTFAQKCGAGPIAKDPYNIILIISHMVSIIRRVLHKGRMTDQSNLASGGSPKW